MKSLIGLEIKRRSIIMIEKSMQVQLPSGMEARPVAVLVQVASKHECTVNMGPEECGALDMTAAKQLLLLRTGRMRSRQ